MTNRNYYTVHRSGCSLKRDSLLGHTRRYSDAGKYGAEVIPLICDFRGIHEISAFYEILTINGEIDYSAFHSLN